MQIVDFYGTPKLLEVYAKRTLQVCESSNFNGIERQKNWTFSLQRFVKSKVCCFYYLFHPKNWSIHNENLVRPSVPMQGFASLLASVKNVTFSTTAPALIYRQLCNIWRTNAFRRSNVESEFYVVIQISNGSSCPRRACDVSHTIMCDPHNVTNLPNFG